MKEESRWSLKPNNQTQDETIVYEQDKWRRVDVPLRLRLFHKILKGKANLFMEYLDCLPKPSELEPQLLIRIVKSRHHRRKTHRKTIMSWRHLAQRIRMLAASLFFNLTITILAVFRETYI